MIRAKTAELIEMPFWLWTQVGPKMGAAYWHNLVNTIVPSTFGGDAAFWVDSSEST